MQQIEYRQRVPHSVSLGIRLEAARLYVREAPRNRAPKHHTICNLTSLYDGATVALSTRKKHEKRLKKDESSLDQDDERKHTYLIENKRKRICPLNTIRTRDVPTFEGKFEEKLRTKNDLLGRQRAIET